MKVAINDSENYEFLFPETATREEAIAIGEHILQRMKFLTNPTLFNKNIEKKNGRHHIGLVRIGKKSPILSREHAIELLSLYYSLNVPKFEKKAKFTAQNIRMKSFASNLKSILHRWNISDEEHEEIKNSMRPRTVPKTEEELKERTKKLEELQGNLSVKDEEDFSKW